ncbi:hypothetical protein [Bacillus methanolicus]|uniref:hypothetical protein n=1 Tax=Bacillus methanolicus TaxID=1471 RepID=UPI00237FEEEE|nr:hypothetical protein [Bacillus methanolicus]
MTNTQSAFFIPSVNLFGPGSVNEVGTRLAGLGVKKALLVTDAGLHGLGLSEKIAGIIRGTYYQLHRKNQDCQMCNKLTLHVSLYNEFPQYEISSYFIIKMNLIQYKEKPILFLTFPYWI